MTPTPGTIEDTSAPASSLSLEELRDPMERLIAQALDRAGYGYGHGDENASRLDFSVPALGVEIEVKQFHSDRVAKQMARADNVIVAQGERAVRLLAQFIERSGTLTTNTSRAEVVEECAPQSNAIRKALRDLSLRLEAARYDRRHEDDGEAVAWLTAGIDAISDSLAAGGPANLYHALWQEAEKEIRALAAAPAAATGGQWESIETAPTNRAVQIYVPDQDYYGNKGVYAGMLVDMGTGPRWMTFGWSIGRDLGREGQPTHWRALPLPPPPAQGGC